MQLTTDLTTVNSKNSKSRTFSFLSTFNNVTGNHFADISARKLYNLIVQRLHRGTHPTMQIIPVGKHCTSLEGIKEQGENYLVD